MITPLQVVLLVLIAGSIVFYIACALTTYQFFTAPQLISSSYPQGVALLPPSGVSIMVPIRGLDEAAWENWSAFCKQDYPRYEVLFGVVDLDDPAISMLEKLVELFPDRVRLFTGLTPRGINHKDSTLSHLLEKAQYDVIIFADSDVQVRPDYIQTVTAPLADPKIGLVTCAFVAHNPRFLGAALASLGRCCDFIPSALVAQKLDRGLKFAIGATIATRKSTLANFGGLHLDRIGSDYNLGKRAAQAGYQVKLSHWVLESDTGRETLRQLFQRELRWSRTIRFNRGAIYYTVIFCYGVVFCIPLLLLSEFADWSIAVTIFTFTVRYLQAFIAALSMDCPKLLRWVWVLPLRDGLSLGVWAIGAFGRGVYWRGRKLKIEGDGIIKPWAQ
ncbi:glycosyltransferase [Phormidesmis priestleyi]